MPKLVVKLGELVEEYSLDKQQMEVGRDTGCDITLSDPSVSRRHARLVRIFSDYFIEDQDSTNGTILNKVNVKKHLLKDGDLIKIGNFKLTYHDAPDDEIELPDTDLSEPLDKTMLLQREQAEFNAVSSRLSFDAEEKRAGLVALDGENKGQTKALNRSMVTLGQPGGDVAVITRRPQGFFLLYVGGKSYPKVNGVDVSRGGVGLKDSDVVEVGDMKFTFTEDFSQD